MVAFLTAKDSESTEEAKLKADHELFILETNYELAITLITE